MTILSRFFCLIIFFIIYSGLSSHAQADMVATVSFTADRSVKFIYREEEPSVLLVKSGNSQLNLQELATVLQQGLAKLFPQQRLPNELKSISLGRLQDYPEWSQRLALAASQSKNWDSRRGRPSQGMRYINNMVRDMLNSSAYPIEFRTVLQHWQTQLCVGSVEKVLVFPAHAITWFTSPGPLSGALRLPVDGQIWLALHPCGYPCEERALH